MQPFYTTDWTKLSIAKGGSIDSCVNIVILTVVWIIFGLSSCILACVIQVSNSATQSTDIHYWIGNTSSQDEQGASAIYVTQLDECLGSSPIQHREVQGSESAKFKSYFKNGLMWVK